MRSRCSGLGSPTSSSKFLTMASASASSHSRSPGLKGRPSRQRANVLFVRRNASSRKWSRQSCSLARAAGIGFAHGALWQLPGTGAFTAHPKTLGIHIPRISGQSLPQFFAAAELSAVGASQNVTDGTRNDRPSRLGELDRARPANLCMSLPDWLRSRANILVTMYGATPSLPRFGLCTRGKKARK